MTDLKFAFRQIFRTPNTSLVIVLTLAIAIGATTAIYSTVDALILNPLPGKAERLLRVESLKKQDAWMHLTSPQAIRDLRENQTVFGEPAVYASSHRYVTGGPITQFMAAAVVTPNFFSYLGVPPLLGRTFNQHEADPGAEKVVILSHHTWQDQWGGDPEIIGKPIKLTESRRYAGEFHTVVGVMPPHFKFPRGDIRCWLPGDPASTVVDENKRWKRSLFAILSLPEDSSPERAQAALDVIAARHAQEDNSRYAQQYGSWSMRLGRVSDGFASEAVRRVLWTLFAVILVVWLIVCANVANLLIARGEARQHEFAVRGALGASRIRVIRQILTESLLLALLGSIAGLLIAMWGIELLNAYSAGKALRAIELNWSMFACSTALAIVTGLIVGAAPAWQMSKPQLQEILNQSGIRTTQTKGRRLLTRGLIAGEIALTMILLSGAGLMIHSVVRLLNVDLGYAPENLIRIAAITPKSTSATAFHNSLHQKLTSVPGVKSVGTIGGWNYMTRESVATADGQTADIDHHFAGYGDLNPFPALGVPLVAGRHLDRHDLNLNSVVINETCAALLWPGQKAVGQRFQADKSKGASRTWEVVGVVKDFRMTQFELEPRPTYYRPTDADPSKVSTARIDHFVFVRTHGDPEPVVSSVQIAMKNAGATSLAPDFRIVSDLFRWATQPRREFMLYLSLFAGVGLVVSAIGLYGLLACSVTRRTREFGVRVALGATTRQILLLVMSDGAKLAGIGLVIGILGACAATRVLRNQLFEIAPRDPFTLSLVAIVLLLTTLASTYLCARRATRISPSEALKIE